MSIILHQVSKMDTFTFIVNGLPFRLSSSSSNATLVVVTFSSYGIILILEIVNRHETPLFRYFYYS